ncbi:MAG: 16S rRNA (guanine(966)-N(2))-methyltransferase RsmD [Flavobacteriales bacterium CG11_big_fil_rev_8_21_14_0_20_35_7]|nr:MAG: 16S rRNA (guanine(966)-N(2))-methyltransferase RsmD [Flavobacteriales bacterium CG11_big_fil_rev_8_21_14_0_20_35_7]
MRIISGTHKGRRITAPKNDSIRPTTDFAKEALFNILNNQFYFDAISVLDLCCGIGSISFEFASRGCTNITSVDEQLSTLKFINGVAKDFEFKIDTFKSDLYKFLDKTNQKYDVIFSDPPYSFTDLQFEQIVNTVFSRQLLNEAGLLIIEHSKSSDLSGFQNYTYSKKYGGSVFSFFRILD